MKLPAYPRTKPSGVDWLGDVPEHWEVKRLRWVGEAIIGLTYSPTDVVSEGEGTLVLRSSNIQDGRIVLDDNVFVSTEIPLKLRTRANDIVICTRNGSRDLVGKTGKISARESSLTFGAFTAVFRSPANDYMFYVFNSGLFSFQAGLYQTSTIFQLTNGTINAFQIPIPPLPEQRAIAAFLDRETGRVDRLVAKKRELIERLKEKRTALISRTVTRGLPPAAARAAGLPENPPLKPTRTDWLGDIPAHWEVKKGRYVGILFGSVSPSEDEFIEDDNEQDDALPFAKVDDLNQIDGSLELSAIKARVRGYRARPGAFLLFPKRGAAIFTNKVAIAKRPLLFDSNLMGWQVNSSFAVKFVAYCLIARRLDDLADVSTVPQINNKHIDPAAFPYPPLSEQVAIAGYLDGATAKLDALVGKVEEAVERLQEYRTALITAAVTGKIDVRKAQIP